jgi:hypothetical protein
MFIKNARWMCSTLIDLFPFNLQSAPRGKIILIESNAKCRHLKKWHGKGLCGWWLSV